MTILIQGGTILDGTGAAGYPGSLLIREDRIEAILPPDVSASADMVIDAKGRIVCPGFIDTHSHSDLQLLKDGVILPKLHQGITTEILGQDGVSVAPLKDSDRDAWLESLSGLEGETPEGVSVSLPTVASYFSAIEQENPVLNYAYLTPHGNLRLSVMGWENSLAGEAQLREMEELLRQTLEDGAVGLSTGLVYIPCVYGNQEELTRLCRIAAEYDVPFVVHQRSEGDDVLESMDELISAAEVSGAHLHISHFKVTSRRNLPKLDDVLRKVDEAKARGVRITADQYPYIMGSTMLGRVIPPWAHADGKLLENMKDPVIREKIREDILYTTTKWDNTISICTQEQIFVSSVTLPKNECFVGKNIVEIGAMVGKDPLDAMMDLLIEEENHVGMICGDATEECMRRIQRRTDVCGCTDGLLGGKPHPRVYGAFPRVLGTYVRELGNLPLELAIYKMTGLPASIFHLKDRGQIREGAFADIVVFDYETIWGNDDYLDPMQYARGIDAVLVNGVPALLNGEERLEHRGGRVLKPHR